MNSYEALIIGRFFLGVFASVGTGAVECVVAVSDYFSLKLNHRMIWSSGVAPSYAGEISAVHNRGTIGSLFTSFVAVGSLFGNILGLSQVISVLIADTVDEWFSTAVLRPHAAPKQPLCGPKQSFKKTFNILCNKPRSAMKQNVSVELC